MTSLWICRQPIASPESPRARSLPPDSTAIKAVKSISVIISYPPPWKVRLHLCVFLRRVQFWPGCHGRQTGLFRKWATREMSQLRTGSGKIRSACKIQWCALISLDHHLQRGRLVAKMFGLRNNGLKADSVRAGGTDKQRETGVALFNLRNQRGRKTDTDWRRKIVKIMFFYWFCFCHKLLIYNNLYVAIYILCPLVQKNDV